MANNTNTESEIINSSAEDKAAKRMLAWIASSKQKSGEKESLSSEDSDSAADTTDQEKDSFHQKVVKDSGSFFDDNPFDTHPTGQFKSVFASRLSTSSLTLTPRASRPPSSSASTPKRTRSPSPALVNGIKSVRKE